MRRWNLLVAAGAVAIALIVAAVARAGPPGWIFGPAPTQANVTFQTDSGQSAFYEVITSPQPITGLTCPGGAHAVFPFNGNLDVGECGPAYIDRRAFAPGNYSVEVRAADQGKTETVFGAGIHNLMQVRVLLHH